jgi:hypothetical protein
LGKFIGVRDVLTEVVEVDTDSTSFLVTVAAPEIKEIVTRGF